MRLVSGGAWLLAIAACSSDITAPRNPPTPETFAPLPTFPGATVERGIAYASASPSEKLDLYVPVHGKKPYPLVLRFNGSAHGPTATAINDAGYALAIVGFRPAAEAPYPAAARDAKAAVRYLRANAEKYGLDANRFIAWGSSEGGWFAAMLGVTGDQATIFDAPELGNAGVSSAVQVVIDWGGASDFATLDTNQAAHPPAACIETYQRHSLPGSAEAAWLCGDRNAALADPSCAPALRSSNLVPYVATAKTLPAFQISHGGDDCVISWWQSVELLEALKKREQTPDFHKLSRTGHDDPRFELEETARAMATIHGVFHPDAGAN